MNIGFTCRCGHGADLDDFIHPGLKPWELRCPACGIVISKRYDIPDVISEQDIDLYRECGVVPGKVVIDVKPQMELAV